MPFPAKEVDAILKRKHEYTLKEIFQVGLSKRRERRPIFLLEGTHSTYNNIEKLNI